MPEPDDHAPPAGLPGLAQSVAALALAHGPAFPTSTLIKTTFKMMAWTKAKTAVVTAVIVLLPAGFVPVITREIPTHANSPSGPAAR